VSVSSRTKQTQIPPRAVDVLAYFLRNPHAADTLEGVARWRLLEEGVHRGVREVGDAIAWLIEHDYLRQEGYQDGGRRGLLFHLNERKIDDAQQLLRRSGTGAGTEE
jgi:hypothetical protein